AAATVADRDGRAWHPCDARVPAGGPVRGATRGARGGRRMTSHADDRPTSHPDPDPGRPPAATRRRFLTGALALGATLPIVGWGRPGCHRPPQPPARLPDGRFRLGVASGDPLPHRAVLWTRLAPAPLGGRGMPAVDVPVRWAGAHDDAFRPAVRSGTAVAPPRRGLGRRRRLAGRGALGARRRGRAGPRPLVPLPVRRRRRGQPGRAHPHGPRPRPPAGPAAVPLRQLPELAAGPLAAVGPRPVRGPRPRGAPR